MKTVVGHDEQHWRIGFPGTTVETKNFDDIIE